MGMNPDGTKLYAATPMAIRRDEELSFRAKAIAYFVWAEDPKKWRVSIAALAKETGLSRNTVSAAVDELEKRGWLVRQYSYRRLGNAKPTGEVWHLQAANAPFSAEEIACLSAPILLDDNGQPCVAGEQGSDAVAPETLRSQEAGFSEPCSPREQGTPEPCSPREQHRSEGSRSESFEEVKRARAARQSPLLAPVADSETDNCSEPSNPQRDTASRASLELVPTKPLGVNDTIARPVVAANTFEGSYDIYPRKGGSGNARRAYDEAIKEVGKRFPGIDPDAVIHRAVSNYASKPGVHTDQYTPGFTKWLDDRHWLQWVNPPQAALPKKDANVLDWEQKKQRPVTSRPSPRNALSNNPTAIEQHPPDPGPDIELEPADWSVA
ncbi:hypothetical protein A5780_19320 [Nocardia sp. 852002-20019_SCH5090214]|nr:hypothetical protein A5780_19320 [Nocardia sp. 852002-20019_SCH5090214]